jgi:hypothetical protein
MTNNQDFTHRYYTYLECLNGYRINNSMDFLNYIQEFRNCKKLFISNEASFDSSLIENFDKYSMTSNFRERFFFVPTRFIVQNLELYINELEMLQKMYEHIELHSELSVDFDRSEPSINVTIEEQKYEIDRDHREYLVNLINKNE